jgi:hypothetical protein
VFVQRRHGRCRVRARAGLGRARGELAAGGPQPFLLAGDRLLQLGQAAPHGAVVLAGADLPDLLLEGGVPPRQLLLPFPALGLELGPPSVGLAACRCPEGLLPLGVPAQAPDLLDYEPHQRRRRDSPRRASAATGRAYSLAAAGQVLGVSMRLDGFFFA